MAQIKQSEAGTGRKYVVMQGRAYPGGVLHLQGAGHKANRKYGISFNVTPGDENTNYVDGQDRTLDSMANTGQKYYPVFVRPRQTTIHFQVKNGSTNRNYGRAFDVPREGNEALWTWLAEAILLSE